MANCDIANGRVEQCKDSIAGLQAVYFINYQTGSFTIDASNRITDFPAGLTAYKYELKGNNSYTETVNTSRENGTTFFTQELALTLKKLDSTMTKNVKLLASGRTQIVVHTRSGEAFLVGKNEGADMTGGTIVTGQAHGDLSGYTLTFQGMEVAPANFLSGSTVANPFFATANDPSIVYS
jgi:hypothetical protein